MHTKSVLFNDGWSFLKLPLSSSFEEAMASHDWQEVEIPHDFLIYNVLNLDESADGWYRKTFQKSEAAHDYITFDGVYMDSEVFINGVSVFTWKYGYSTFSFDMAPFLEDGENEIVVRATFHCPNSRWYSGAGIYRNVYRTATPDCHFAINGSYYAPRLADGVWTLHCAYEILNPNPQSRISMRLVSEDGEELASYGADLSSFSDPAHPSFSVPVENPLLWSTKTPVLYKIRASVTTFTKPEQYDALSERIGFKDARFDKENGLFINGEHLKVYGACEHHDLGALGSAVNITALRRQLTLLKEMGVNAIRTSHNMPARELMDLCDEMGLLVDSEAFDMWQRPKTEFDYARFFDEWHARDVESWIKRDRNHASLLMWSIGNEIADTHADPERATEVIKDLSRLCRLYDPLKNAPITFGSNYMPWENTQKCADYLELVGYNYAEYIYQKHHEEHPDWIIYGSETASTCQSRGVYHFPLSQSLLANDDCQCSSLGNCTTSWGSKNTQTNIILDRDTPFSLGQFIWSGFDYIGEPTPYFTKNTYLGQIDTAGYPKDSYYAYKAEWTDYRESPMVHLQPYWDFNDGEPIDVRIVSNCPLVKLFLNDRLLGQKQFDHAHGLSLTADFLVPYEQGCLKALGCEEDGTVLCTDVQASYGDPASISAVPSKDTLICDGADMIFIDLSCLDSNGVMVQNARNRLTVSVTGAARLVGLDNGDSTDYEAYKGVSRRLFQGRLLAMLMGNGKTGSITVNITSEGLPGTTLSLKAVAGEIPFGTSTVYTENRPYEGFLDMPSGGVLKKALPIDAHEISIRKIALYAEGPRNFSKDYTKVFVRFEVYPKNATYNDVFFKVVNDAGIPVKCASVEPVPGEENVVMLTALGDGNFRLRACARNGRDVTEIMSDLTFTAEGLGSAALNPYEFISAGLYTDHLGDIGNGNERGIASMRTEDTIVTFDNLAFGDYGSDTLTIPFFFNSNAPFPFEIYEGMPGRDEDARLLLPAVYHEKTIWNTYIEETFVLPKRLKGNVNLSFVFHEKAHCKGFLFKEYNKAYSRLLGSDRNAISGDTFEINGSSILGIGNNVSITYAGLVFGEAGVKGVTIRGRGNSNNNPVHLRFKGDGVQANLVVDFKPTDEMSEQHFALSGIAGTGDLSLVFLPGSNFDFEWIQFD